MSIAIYINLSDFLDALQDGSIVYLVSYTETIAGDIDSVVVLTSDAGSNGGMIHAVRLIIVGESDSKASLKAFPVLENLLSVKGMHTRQGLLMESGLTESLRYYKKTGITYSVEELVKRLNDAKKGLKEPDFPPFVEASEDK